MNSFTCYVLVVGFYIAWIASHYAATHAYVKFCTPNTLWGFIMSPLVASMPHCEGLRWVISNGGSNIATMWVLAGVWVTTKVAGIW
jgi:hypothetical protein